MILSILKLGKASKVPNLGKALLAFLFAVFLAVVGFVVSSAFADDSHTPLEPLDCPGEMPAGEAAICFIFHLPADWSDLSGRSVEVPVMRFAPTGDLDEAAKANKPPLLVILGGPGQSAIYLRHVMLQRLAPLRKDRELILMDQRGTGPLNLELACEDALDDGNKVDIEKVLKCAKSAKTEGIHLSDYTTGATARDYRALRYALKIDKWDVIATSYGARVAQKLLVLDEKGTNRLVLNSPHFLHSLLIDWDPFPLVEKVMEQCNEDEVCRNSYPSLYWDFQALRFDIGKVELSEKALSLIKEGKEAAEELGPDGKEDYIKGLVYLLYRQRLQSLLARHRSGEVPHDIWKTMISLQKALQTEKAWSPPEPLTSNSKKISQLLHYTIFCQEDGARMQAKGWDAITQPLYAHFYKAICTKLDGPKLKAGWDKIKKSKTPILILSGDLDTVVDPNSAQGVLEFYTKAIWVRFPSSGHDVPSQNLCARQIMWDFLNGKKLVTNCIGKKPLIFLQPDQAIRTTG